MELHSYAKRRTTKKWTFEQKRKLVEARITHDAIFINEPRNSVLPWKKILALAKLDDFNVFFVRKQWSNMVAKYKQYKQIRLGNIPTKAIDNEMIQKITQEWEYFQPIHHFMTRKTTNLHSYALTRREPQTGRDTHHDYAKCQQPSPEQDNQASTSSLERANLFSSDTNEDFAIKPKEEFQQVETDREFYWHHQDGSVEEDATMDCNSNVDIKASLSYFADASEDTQESLITKSIPILNTQENREFINLLEFGTSACTTSTASTTTVTASTSAAAVGIKQSNKGNLILPQRNSTDNCGGGRSNAKSAQLENSIGQQVPKRIMLSRKTHLSEREKYYRHKRRFNRRLERRFDSLLNVFGQIIRAEYPSIDVSPLLGAATTTTSAVINTLFSSDDDEYEHNNAGSSCDDNNDNDDKMKVTSNKNVGRQQSPSKQQNGH